MAEWKVHTVLAAFSKFFARAFSLWLPRVILTDWFLFVTQSVGAGLRSGSKTGKSGRSRREEQQSGGSLWGKRIGPSSALVPIGRPRDSTILSPSTNHEHLISSCTSDEWWTWWTRRGMKVLIWTNSQFRTRISLTTHWARVMNQSSDSVHSPALFTGQRRKSSTETSTSDQTGHSREIQQLTPFLIRQSHLLAVMYTRFYHRATMRLSA